MNTTYEAGIGENINTATNTAKALAIKKDQVVEFDFNGILCVVNKDTDPKLLTRDYGNAHKMGWTTIGPIFLSKYDDATISNIAQVDKTNEEKRAIQAEKNRITEDAQRKSLAEKTKDIVMEFSDTEGWEKTTANNKDGYGSGIVRYAENWAKLMQLEIGNGKKLTEVADHASHEADTEGITGFMYGAAVQILSHCWIHGEDLRKWHNKDYGHKGDGVINPAILTVNV